MKKKLTLILVSLFLISLMPTRSLRAEVPAKTKAFLTMAFYGASGGAMLGMASIAFGGNSRAIAQGASLGLYAGIIFASYVIFSHNQRSRGYYDDSSPYQESSDIYGSGLEGSAGDDERGGFFERFHIRDLEYELNPSRFSRTKSGSMPPLKINLFRVQF